ncbi:putative RDD family membrane protein YckC [Cellulomonas sp. PhB150]|nr:putative RDD family membrane protein YckC [Cellulomonas sp. PhB150]
MADPDDEQPGARPTAWHPTPAVPFPRPAPPDEPAVLTGTPVPPPSPPARSEVPGWPLRASWRPRVTAFALDVTVMTAPLLIALAYDDAVVAGLGIAWWLAWFVGNRVLAQGRYGASLGKQLTGLRLVRESTGLPVGARGALVRELAHVTDAVLLVGLLRPLWDARRRTFADSLCATAAVQLPD